MKHASPLSGSKIAPFKLIPNLFKLSWTFEKKVPVGDPPIVIATSLNAISEGKAIFDFVDDNIELSEIGIMPIYKNEGYFFISDVKNQLLKIYRYEMSLFSTVDNPLRTLKSKLVDLISLAAPEAQSKYDLKNMLLKKHPDLPNPAIYSFETGLDFPFVETILPVAKRKLVRTLAQ